MISRCSRLNFQPCWTKSAANQSSNSGCVGLPPLAPRLFGLAASGWPKCCCQTRLTMERAVNGFPGSAIQRANARRRPSSGSLIWYGSLALAPGTGTPKALSTPGVTATPGASNEPPLRMRLSGRHCLLARAFMRSLRAFRKFGTGPLYTDCASGW